jgi:hypothetical protein
MLMLEYDWSNFYVKVYVAFGFMIANAKCSSSSLVTCGLMILPQVNNTLNEDLCHWSNIIIGVILRCIGMRSHTTYLFMNQLPKRQLLDQT